MQAIRVLLLSGLMLPSFLSVSFATDSLLEVADINQAPIQVGETLVYNVKVAGLPAGKQVTRVVGVTTFNGQSVYHLTSERQSGSMFGRFYHFRDKVESYITADRLYPVRFTKDLEDRKYKAHVEVGFDHANGMVQYTKADASNRRSKNLKAPAGIQDELSMLYFLRSKRLRVGQTYTFPVLVRDQSRNIKLTVYRRQMIKTKALGRVETLALRTSHGHLIWLTNDDRRTPVRIEAALPVGKLVGVLEKVDFAPIVKERVENSEIGN